MSEKFVYKILPPAAWEEARRSGVVAPSADDRRDGFLHLSAGGQIPGTLARHFATEPAVALVAFDAAALGAALRWERSRDGALFPHLYGALPAELAVGVWTLTRGRDGAFVLPAEIA
jgi:uncharacterized protein (DUF952 family)